MKPRFAAACAALMLLCLPLIAGSAEEYLDVMTVKVRPEKRAEFDQIVRKIVNVNRNNDGDRWLTGETLYGEQNTLYIVSFRKSYSEIEQGYEAFMTAMTKGLGEGAALQLLQDFNNCIVSSRTEVRRRRWDLSINAPADAAAGTRTLGESRYYRATVFHVRSGHIPDFESAVRIAKEAREQAKTPYRSWVSQAVAGQQGTVFYAASLQPSLAAFDQSTPTLKELLGDDAYQRFGKFWAESVIDTETVINRWVPELSNPPEEVVSVAPSFWRPKSAPSTTAP